MNDLISFNNSIRGSGVRIAADNTIYSFLQVLRAIYVCNFLSHNIGTPARIITKCVLDKNESDFSMPVSDHPYENSTST